MKIPLDNSTEGNIIDSRQIYYTIKHYTTEHTQQYIHNRRTETKEI